MCNGTETCDPVMGCQAGTALMCDDGDTCNGSETCDAVMGCQAGTALVCDDTDVCTTDSCDPVNGCQYAPDAVACPTVTVTAAGFSLASVSVNAGATVTFQNMDAVDVQLVITALAIDQTIAPLNALPVQFDTAGSYTVEDTNTANTMTVDVN